ncbi:LysR family transcriptional regulator [Bacillus cereus]|uniref:LysR family transcriptional regulator n=1 Tax=Bacillus cereus TaxID=1396 RepID=UPI000BED2932|nr:LysR family transcriptional regulator [Bacillus cereus]PDZ04628.1 LysR family transcriptional regulator [Bacillus cereus]PEC55521.1 LysR family transcriptional regulator [Bacillus cereus]PFE50616.1 LysR family transcriptional regulator [Bacillus cereus]PFN15810.1 LysR family transcriptional regulator [Bacillus cereus]PFS83287.1 LysR family transcriptional regulator [Bacillus cereus]
MDTRKLRYFTVIAEEKQLTRAAQRLHMAQPPLSRQLSLLEQELSVSLFERNGRNMHLTEEGKILYTKAKNIIQQLEETITEIKDTGEGLRGNLSIGAFHSCIPFLSEKIRYFQDNYPHVNLKIWEGGPLYLIEQLENRNIELAILRAPFNEDVFSSISLSKEPFVLVMPAKWELYHSQLPIPLTELSHIPLLLLHKDTENSYHQLVIDECMNLGIQLNIACECPDSAFILMLIMTGIGASILPKSAVSHIPQEFIKIVDVMDFPYQSESSIIWLKDRKLSKRAQRFIECT